MDIKIIETGELANLEGNEWIVDADLNENDEYEMTQDNYDWWEEYLADRRKDKEEAEALAEELEVELSEIQARLNEECNPLDADSEHDERQRVMAEIREEHEMKTTREQELARAIKDAKDWEEVQEELGELCELADMEEEWRAADGESFEGVILKAAEKLGVEVI